LEKEIQKTELNGFSDASEIAYGAYIHGDSEVICAI
jgi:hypothetical protein